ncbi:MAG: hypothetical protein ABI629_12780 [bacterium]
MTRLRVALAAVIAAALLPSAGIVLQLAGNPRLLTWRDDPISAFERHIAPLRDALRGEPVVGYWASSPLIPNRTAHRYSLRYALAPVQVRNTIDLPLVVADGVTDPQSLPAQLRVRRDFGNGLLLLEHAP